jgi:monovalent cation/hydrogen antiporter
LIRLLDLKPANDVDKEAKELELYVVNSTLHYIDHELNMKLEPRTREELKLKYKMLGEKLAKEIDTHTQNENEVDQVPVRTLTAIQQAQIEIVRFQRELLLQFHKNGEFSDAAIKEVERDMDITELKLNQLLPEKN